MKRQTNPSIKAHLLWSVLTLLAVCAIPFALAQRNAIKQSGKQNSQSQKALGQSRLITSTDSVQTPDLSQWTIVAPYPHAVENHAVASDGTFAYSAGGLVLVKASNGFYRYDPVANTWAALANLPIAAFDAGAVYASNTNSVYVFGGAADFFTTLNNTQIYNVATGTWSAGAPMPAGRSLASVVYYPGNGKIYVIGGIDSENTRYRQVWEYDPVADTWNTSRADMPMALGGSGHSVVGQFIYIAGVSVTPVLRMCITVTISLPTRGPKWRLCLLASIYLPPPRLGHKPI